MEKKTDNIDILERLECFEPDDLVECAMYRECIEAIETLIEENKEVKEEIEELKENNGYHLGFIDGGIAKRYEYEYKIKAKIEIRKEEKENCKDSIEEKYLLREIYVLQSLLGKE